VYALVGVVTFLVQPPGATATSVQVTGYVVAGAGMLAWLLVDVLPAATWYRSRLLPVVLVAIAASAGVAATAGEHENSCSVMLAHAAALAAGTDAGLLTGWLVAGAGVLGIDINALIYHDAYQQASNYLLMPLVPLAGLLFGRLVQQRRTQIEQSETLLARTQQLQAEQRRADVLGERARIAREIHDVLAHSLGALGIQIQAARALLTDHGDVGRAVDELVTAQRMAAAGLAETRRAVHALRSDVHPLDEELESVTRTHAQRYQVEVSLRVGGTPGPLPVEATSALLRTAQESLVNAAKHASGQPIAVDLEYDGREARLTVVNHLSPGHATEPIPSRSITGGYGLTGMQERLRLLGGTLDVGPNGSTWAVVATLPLIAALPRRPPA
jgi:signal transduction histidine kinase